MESQATKKEVRPARVSVRWSGRRRKRRIIGRKNKSLFGPTGTRTEM